MTRPVKIPRSKRESNPGYSALEVHGRENPSTAPAVAGVCLLRVVHLTTLQWPLQEKRDGVYLPSVPPPRWPSGSGVRLESGRSRFRIPLATGFFFLRGRVIPVTSKLALQWLPSQAPGVIGSALGLAGPVSVYCDWVRQKVWSATSISVWQHVKIV